MSRRELLRSALLSRVDSAEPRVVVLEAPAGYGKSTVARQLVRGSTEMVTLDARGVHGVGDFARRIVETLGPRLTPEQRTAVEREAALVGGDEDLWSALARESWRFSTTEHWFVLENAERLTEDGALIAFFDELLEVVPAERRLMICTRTSLGLRLSAAAAPHEILTLTAHDLRFTATEVETALGAIPRETVDSVVMLSGGWPMAVYLLRRLHDEGQLSRSSDIPENFELADYLCNEVLRLLQPSTLRLLIATSAIPDATDAELASALGVQNAKSLIRRTLEEVPFFVAAGEAFAVHPLMQPTLVKRYPDAAREAQIAAAVANEQAGYELRAAHLYLEAEEPGRAARAIRSVRDFWTPGAPPLELSGIIARLPSHALVSNPALWAGASTFKRYYVDAYQTLSEGLRIWERSSALDSVTRSNVAETILETYYRRGEIDEAHAFFCSYRASLDRDELMRYDPLLALWEAAEHAYRGGTNIEQFEHRVRPRLLNPKLFAIYQHDVVARAYRARGDTVAERASLGRALDAANACGQGLVRMLCTIDYAFTAWRLGDDAMFDDFVARLEALHTPALARGMDHFLNCVHGRPAEGALEKLQFRCWGWLIAAARAREPGLRATLAGRAREAADESSQPYAMALSRIASALCEPERRETWLAEAIEIAGNAGMDLMRADAEALRSGGEPRMLRAFVDRFTLRNAARVDVAIDSVSVAGEDVALADRPRQIVMYLACSGRPVHRQELLSALWPDDDPARALTSLRTLVSRVRELTGDREFIVVHERGYALGPHVLTDLAEIRRDWKDAQHRSSLGSRPLLGHLEHLSLRERGRAERWEWFAVREREFEDLIHHIGQYLGRRAVLRADARELLAIARALLRADATDEMGRAYAVRANLIAGDRLAAEHEVGEHERVLRTELLVGGPSSLRSLLDERSSA